MLTHSTFLRSSSVLVWLIVLGTIAPIRCISRPKGRSVLTNGDFRADPERPVTWVTRGANLGSFSLKPPEEGNDSAILVVEVKEASPRAWSMEIRQTLAPELEAGETLYFTFEYRMTPGYAFNCYWQQNTAPWDKFMSIRFNEPYGEWQKCAMAVGNYATRAPKSTSLTFHLAEQAGTLELRDINTTAFPPGISIETLPTNFDPVFGGDYYDSTWRTKVLGRLTSVRQGKLDVRVLRGGKPVADVPVSVVQKTRRFVVGLEIPAPLFHDSLATNPALSSFREMAEGHEAELEKYRAKVYTPRLFNGICLREALVWRSYADWGGPIASAVLDLFVSRGYHVRGHALFCPAFRFAPPECREMSERQLGLSLKKHITALVTTYRGKVSQWDVVHAPLSYEELYDVLGEESLVDAFKIAEKHDPEAMLTLTDDTALLSVSTDPLEELLALVRWLRSQGARIDGLCLEAKMRRPYIAPQAVETRLDRIAEQTQLPIVITGLAVESPKEAIQADRLRDLLLLFFSHSAVKGVYLAGIWEADMTPRKAALYRRHNFAIKEAGKVFEQLLARDWWTEVQLTTGPDGIATTPAFYGHHEVTVDVEGKQVKREVALLEERARVEVELPK